MTTDDLLAWLMEQLASFPGRVPARVELSVEDGSVVAQLMADALPLPLVGTGADAAEALTVLKANIEQAIRNARRRARARAVRRRPS